MRRSRGRARKALAGIGAATVVVALAIDGGAVHGTAASVAGTAVHAGAFAVLVAGAATALDRTAVRPALRGVAAAAVALAALYVLAVGYVWIDPSLGPPSPTGPPPTIADAALGRLSVVPLLTPLASGYGIAAFDGASRDGGTAAIPIFAVALAVTGPVLAAAVGASGARSGLVLVAYGVLTVGSVVASVPFYLAGRFENGDQSGTEKS